MEAKSDIEEDSQNKNESCLSLTAQALIWYFKPLTCDIGFSILCVVYIMYYAITSLLLFIFQVVSLSVGIPLIILACSGILILWVALEKSVIFARIDVAVAYSLVERGINGVMPSSDMLALSVYTAHMPACCCFSVDGCCSSIISRMKYFFSSLDVWIIVFYQTIVRQFLCLLLGWTCIIVFCFLFMMTIPFFYAFKGDHERVCIYTVIPCSVNDNDCVCHGWELESMTESIAIFLLLLMIFPSALHLNNATATIFKRGVYYFCTNYYSSDGYEEEKLLPSSPVPNQKSQQPIPENSIEQSRGASEVTDGNPTKSDEIGPWNML